MFGWVADFGVGLGTGSLPQQDLGLEQGLMSLVVLLCLLEQAVELRVPRQVQVTEFAVAVMKLTQVAGVESLLPASVAGVVHTAEAAGRTLVVCSVALAFADGRYTEDSWVRLLVATVSAGAWERERCSGDEQVVGPWAEMLEVLVFDANSCFVRAQERHGVIAGPYAAAVDDSADMVDVVDKWVVFGSAARWEHLMAKNVNPAWAGSV